MTRLWIVRAGSNGEREQEVITQGRLMLGFMDVDDLSGMPNREAIATHLRQVMPQAGDNRVRNFAAQLNQFVNTIEVGDLVVLPRKLTSGVAIGEVTGDYAFDPHGVSRHTRAVNWLQEAIPRDVFAQDLRHSFGAFMTVCEIKRNAALERVRKVLLTGTDPGPLLGTQGTISSASIGMAPSAQSDSDAIDAESAPLDIEDYARQQIAALIKSAFAGHALADLVAEILNLQGYLTRVSPPGADGGVDILAAGGRIGLGEDRICVQVKSGDGPANSDVVLKLLGSMQTSKAKTGLLVSIGGVNQPAQKILDDNFFTLRLWQMSHLLEALFSVYDHLKDETRLRLPLKQVWAPAAIGDS
jgi:restriction system protein